MSLTSYRTAPPRARCFFIVLERMWAFTRFGGDLLSRGLSPSTIGAAVLNFRVRDGTGCFTCAMTTKPRKSPRRVLRSKRDGWQAAYLLANARCHSVVMSINTVAVCAAKATRGRQRIRLRMRVPASELSNSRCVCFWLICSPTVSP